MTQVIENIGGEYRNRTGVHGFAIRCVTTPPTRHPWCDRLYNSGFCTRPDAQTVIAASLLLWQNSVNQTPL